MPEDVKAISFKGSILEEIAIDFDDGETLSIRIGGVMIENKDGKEDRRDAVLTLNKPHELHLSHSENGVLDSAELWAEGPFGKRLELEDMIGGAECSHLYLFIREPFAICSIQSVSAELKLL